MDRHECGIKLVGQVRKQIEVIPQNVKPVTSNISMRSSFVHITLELFSPHTHTIILPPMPHCDSEEPGCPSCVHQTSFSSVSVVLLLLSVWRGEEDVLCEDYADGSVNPSVAEISMLHTAANHSTTHCIVPD